MAFAGSGFSAPLAVGSVGLSGRYVVPVDFRDVVSRLVAAPLSVDGPRYSAALSQNETSFPLGDVGAWAGRLAMADVGVVNAPYDCAILLDGNDITHKVSRCVLTNRETEIFDTVTVDVEDLSLKISSGSLNRLQVLFSDVTHDFTIEEITGSGEESGLKRTLWGRPDSAVLAEPFALPAVWNPATTFAVTASGLADDMAGSVPLDWQLDDWGLPPKFELNETPILALSGLIKPMGGIIDAGSVDAGLLVRRRWPVRPVNLGTAAPTVEINRDVALEMTITDTAAATYGRVIVSGYTGGVAMPSYTVEGSPVSDKPVIIRLYWPGPNHPSFNSFTTDGSARLLETIEETLTETVTFADGVGHTVKPIWSLRRWTWEGHNSGTIRQQDDKYTTGLAISDPLQYGVAEVVYQTTYEKWELTDHSVETVMFGIKVLSADIAAEVVFTSGGDFLGEIKEPLLNTLAACAISGTAHLDNTKPRYTVQATIPRLRHIRTGETLRADDELLGITGYGKVTVVETTISPDRITQGIQGALC
jgi:hypothetical protein